MKTKNRYLRLLTLSFMGLLATAIPAMAETTARTTCSPRLFTNVASIIAPAIVRVINAFGVAITDNQACGAAYVIIILFILAIFGTGIIAERIRAST